ncbi:Ig-like domain-containing protein [Reichenbachiella sp.]
MERTLFSRGLKIILYALAIGFLSIVNNRALFSQQSQSKPSLADSDQSDIQRPQDTVLLELKKVKMKWLKIGAAVALPATLPLIKQTSPSGSNQNPALPTMKAPAPPDDGGGSGGSGGGGSTTYPPPAPSTSFTFSYQCGKTVVTRTSSSTNYKVKWYWQTSSSGKSTSYPGSSFTVTSSRYMYLRAYDLWTDKWSGYKAVYVSMNKKVPSTPGSISVSNQCGKSVLTRPNPPSGVTYYWQSSSSGTSTSNSSKTINRTSGTSYYLRARQNSGGCWSGARSVGYSIKTVPSLPGTISVSNQCGQSVLTRPTPPSGVTYYWQSSSSGTSTSNSSQTITRTSGSTYYLRARHSSGCWSSARSVGYSINAVPSLASGSNKSRCGTGTITLAATPGSNGNTIRWYTAASGGTLLHTGTNYNFNLTSTVTYYAASYNSSTGCEDSDRRAITADYKALPLVYEVSGGGSYCENGNGKSVLLNDSESGATYFLFRDGSGTGQTISGTGSGISFTNQTVAGSYTIQAQKNNCGISMSGSASIMITPNPQKPVVSGGGGYCLGEAGVPISLSFAEPGASYELFRDGNSIGQTTSSASFGNQTAAGTYTVEATKNGCKSNLTETITIEINPLPVDFTVTGGNHCTDDGSLNIGLSSSEVGTTYQLKLDGVSVAAITKAGTGAAITFDQAQTTAGNYTVTATTLESCSLDMTGAATIIQSPQHPVLSGGGVFCEGGSGVAVNLSSAESGTSYELFKDGITTGQTTMAASFGNQVLAGVYTVRATKNGCTSELMDSVNVSINPLPAQPQFEVSSNLCGDKTIIATNSPIEGGTTSWYWQGTSNSSFDTETFDTHGITTSGNYYARSFESTTSCWSDPIQMSVMVNAVPTVPVTTFIETNNCGSTNISRNSNPDAGWTWYWQTDELGETTEATNAQPSFTMTSGSTIYLRSRSNEGCWSTAASTNYSIYAIPEEPDVVVDVTNVCGKSTLIPQSTAPDGYTWYWQGSEDATSLDEPSGSIERSAGAEYYLRAQDNVNGCWSTAKAVGYQIMAVPAPPVALDPTKSCGSTELIMSTVPAGETWYWQLSSDGIDESNSNSSIQKTSGDTHYLRALNDVSACWSETTTVMYSIDEIPPVPQPMIENLCGETKMVKPTDQSGIIYRWEAPAGQTLPEGVSSSTSNFLMEIYKPIKIRATDQSTGCTDVTDVIYTITPIPYVKSSNDKNFVMAVSVQEEGVKTDVNIGCYKNQIKVDYFDGLGRALQTVMPNGSPFEHDIVQAYAYDVYGRQEKEYLPYAKPTSAPGAYVDTVVSEQLKFYDGRTSKVAEDQKPWIQHEFEKSPLDRVLKTYGAGEAWQGTGETPVGKSTQFAVLTNETGVVVKWRLNSTTGLPETDGHHEANTLVLQETRTDATDDEADGQVIHEYADTRGLTVLKRVKIGIEDWLDTYYLYDDWGNVVMVLPPVLADISSPTFSAVSELAFIYQYDEKRRVKSKKLPGTGGDDLTGITKVSDLPGWHEIVYDQWDRVVLTQDPNQEEAKEYLVTKYDALNRPILTGLYESNKSANEMRSSPAASTRSESRSSSSQFGYTRGTAYQPNENDIYSVTYYDDYSFINYSGWNPLNHDFSFKSETGFSSSAFDKVKGQTTGSKVKVLGAETDIWLNTVTYYDDKYRVLQTITENIRGGIERVTFEYDFTGKVLKSLHTQSNDGGVSVFKEFEYDEAGRLLKTWHTINTQDPVLMVENKYNEVGELVEKNLHAEGEDENDFIQSVDYRYNIRGWLTHINNSTLSEDSATNDDLDDLFGMQLAYTANPTVNGHDILPRFDGNISSIRWMTDNKEDEDKEQIFGYDYDLANRLKTARYASGTSGNWTNDAGHYDVEIGAYDKNGNIQSLKRQGNGNLLDDLTYGYKNEGVSNQLDAVSEGESADDQLGFTEEYTLDNEYAYDANGNMITDLNKGITPIIYNHLNLPIEVDWGGGKKIKFMYDAAGIKLRKEVYEGGSTPISTTDYTAMGQFQDDELEFIFTDEGRALPGPVPGTFEYEYFLKDHLGNNRVAFGMLTEVDHFLATMEDEDLDLQNKEQDQFNNVSTTRFAFAEYNRTPMSAQLQAPNKVAKVLNGVGPSKVLSVKEGDKLAVSVYAGYPLADAGNGVPVGEFVAAVAGSFGITASGETQQLFNAFENLAPIAGAAEAGEENRPRGYLNIIIFDEDLTEEPQFAMIEIGTEGHQSMQLLERELTAAFDGTAYIYVANESTASTADIYFDELSIMHTKGKKSLQVTQSSDFYPFGMKMQPVSYQHQGHNVNKYNFQGQEQVTDHDLDWHQFKWRNHDPAIGRFFNIDPLAEDYLYNSTYAFSENKVLNHFELEGLEGVDVKFNNYMKSLGGIRRTGAIYESRMVNRSLFQMGFTNYLPKEFITQYSMGTGSEYILNEQQMRDVRPMPVGLRGLGNVKDNIDYVRFDDMLSKLEPGETMTLENYSIQGGAGNSGTLGQYRVNFNGELQKNIDGENWSFNGEMQFNDVWDFDLQGAPQKGTLGRNPFAESLVKFARENLSGEPFPISSEWVPVYQNSLNMEYMDWFYGFPYEPIQNIPQFMYSTDFR